MGCYRREDIHPRTVEVQSNFNLMSFKVIGIYNRVFFLVFAYLGVLAGLSPKREIIKTRFTK